MLIVITLILSSIFCWINIRIDLKYWESINKGGHRTRFIVRAIPFILLSFYDLKAGLLGFSWFYLWFDPILALKRGLKFFYLGTTAWFDQFGQNGFAILRFGVEAIIFLLILIFL